jgi:hypothetical protein
MGRVDSKADSKADSKGKVGRVDKGKGKGKVDSRGSCRGLVRRRV